jgi:hypothetical protein
MQRLEFFGAIVGVLVLGSSVDSQTFEYGIEIDGLECGDAVSGLAGTEVVVSGWTTITASESGVGCIINGVEVASPDGADFCIGREFVPPQILTGRTAVVDLSDIRAVLGFLFLGSPDSLPCKSVRLAAFVELLDSSGDTDVDISDAIYVARWFVLGGPAPVRGLDCITIEDCPNVCDV